MLQKKIASFLFSTRLMAVLFIVFALALAVGTFIENSYTTETARALIYNAHWFEAIMVLFAINFAGNIVRYKLYKKDKIPTLILHLSFVFIIIGAGITRYISYEGMMPIREGEISNTVYSDKSFLTVYIDGETSEGPKRRIVEEELRLAPGINNNKAVYTDFKGQEIELEVLNFIPNAEKTLVPSEDGERFLKIVESGGQQRHNHYVKEGTVTSIHNVLFALNQDTPGAINFFVNEDGYKIKTPFEGSYVRMSELGMEMRTAGAEETAEAIRSHQNSVVADSLQDLQLRSLYNLAGMQFVIPEPVIKGKFQLQPIPKNQMMGNEAAEDGIVLKITSNGESEIVEFLGGKGTVNPFEKVTVGGLDIRVRYGSKEYKLPFSIKLNDFIASKYPGTEDKPTPSYSAFKSKVEIIDEGKTWPYEIYMNHILDHKGYRFFQASFNPDEKGTILSVNHDWWGTTITYIGYTLLYIGLILILFVKGSRFKELEKALTRIKKRKKKLFSVLVMLLGISGFSLSSAFAQEPHAQDGHIHVHDSLAETAQQPADSLHTESHAQEEFQLIPKETVDSIILKYAVRQEHADEFGRLVIQDNMGRMKPANTFSSELLRKLSGTNDYMGLDGDQMLISMLQRPTLWYNVPLIKIERRNDSLHKILNIEKGRKMVALAEFFDGLGNYKLAPYLESAYRAEVKNQFQKDFIDADQNVNLLHGALSGTLFKIFPIPDAENNKWVSQPKLIELGLEKVDSIPVASILPMYLRALHMAEEDGNYVNADALLTILKEYQKKYGKEVMLSDEKINAEILYNKYNIFNRLFTLYLLGGLVMLIFVIIQIFKHNKFVNTMILLSKIALLLFFVLHTLGLIVRWYISGHAPWSNAYESVIYVAWATMLFGIILGRKSNLTMASTAFVTAIILMVAHWNWLDPAIGNLEPVLDSYWLMIHVSIIVASYGPFTLGMILGVVALILMLATNEKNRTKMAFNIKEITIVNEMALTIGLVMLTIGNFLGGQWANESWGRYWGWDPKETWALVSIMIYAFVIHMRLVPGLKGRFAFNWASILAFGSILMTYFGVNFYLSGLHSYASGDQIISYKFIVISLALWFVLGYFARRKYNKYLKNGTKRTVLKSSRKP